MGRGRVNGVDLCDDHISQILVPFWNGHPMKETTSTHTLRVWDLPTRLFHWLLAACVVAMVVTAKVGGNWMEWHLRLGHVVLALLVFRLLWGGVGGHWSRFAAFPLGPASVLRQLRGRSPVADHIGHSPLGALSVFALIAVLSLQLLTGLLSDDEIAFAGALTRFVDGSTVSQATSFHKGVGQWLVIGWVALHLVAILVHQLALRHNLIGAMVHGNKTTAMTTAPRSSDGLRQRLLALLLALLAAAASYFVHSLGVS